MVECILKIIFLARDPERMAAMAREKLDAMPSVTELKKTIVVF